MKNKKEVVVKFNVIGVYEDDSEDTFEEFDKYEDAEKYIYENTYHAEYFKIEKVFYKKD